MLSVYLPFLRNLCRLSSVLAAISVAGGCTGGFVDRSTGIVDFPSGAIPGGLEITPVDTSRVAVAPKALHRLAAVDFDNSLHDLTGTPLGYAARFPADSPIDNFDNLADSAGLIPAWLDQFVGIAVEVGDAVAASADDPNQKTQIYAKVVQCSATAQAQDCLQSTAKQFGRRAWRRPLTDAEVATLVDGASATGASLPRQVGNLVSLVVASPHFLFRVEDDGGASSGTVRQLTNYEVATRLAYFLWRSTPDDVLLDAAAAGKLADDAGLLTQAERMLADPRATTLVQSFGRRWLLVDGFADKTPDPNVFVGYDATLKADMAAETDLYLRDFLLGERPLREILTDKSTYLTDATAAWYNLPTPGSRTPVKVSLPAANPRHGVLTQGTVLISGSTGVNPSAVRRGKLIMQRLLCDAPDAPPPNITSPISDDATPKTGRQLFTEHTTNPACSGCHVAMDDLGYAFENFDGAARVRATDNGLPVDTTGRYMAGAAFANSQQMAPMLAEDARLAPCFTQLLLTYALGRRVTDDDAAVLDELSRSFAADKQNTRHLIGQIILSKPFRYRTVP